MLRAWLLLLLIVTGCATSSPPPLPVVLPKPTIPSPPAGTEPLPLGGYWARHCEFQLKVQQTLKISPPSSDECAAPGQPAVR